MHMRDILKMSAYSTYPTTQLFKSLQKQIHTNLIDRPHIISTMQKRNQDYLYNKLINAKCPVCSTQFNSSYHKISVCFPCEHLVHDVCATDIIAKLYRH
jgi:hypothetical protein